MTADRWTSGGLTFDLRVGGPADGDPVVLLHGFPQNAAEWDGVTARLNAAGYRTYAPDQRGYSPSARPDGVDAYALDHLVADVLSLLDHLGLASAHVVGHDWGAIVAWHLTARHPDRVRTLTALSVGHPRAFVTALRSDPDQRKKSSYIYFFRRRWIAERVLLAFNARTLRGVFAGSGLSRDDVAETRNRG